MVNQAAINLVKNAVNIVKSVQDSQVQIQNDRAQGKTRGISYNNHRFEKPMHLQSLNKINIHFALTEAFARIGVESSLVETTTERVTPVVESTVTLNSIRQKDILELIQEQAVTVIESATEPTEQVLEEKVKILNAKNLYNFL